MTRSAAEIAAGLAPARDARSIARGERIHVVGVAGAGASAAALLAHAAGAIVDGCDPGVPSQYTPALDAAGIVVAGGHDAAHVAGLGPREARLAVTKALTAVEPDHPELVAARAAGLAIEAWQQVVADAATGRRLVAVAGTHGKSTTAGWLTHVLAGAGRDPSAFVGALLPASVTGGVPGTARIGTGPEFVVEADEYAGNFEPFRPVVAVVTGIEWDHPDVFADRAAVIAAFERWLLAAGEGSGGAEGPGPTLVANVADPGVVALLGRLGDRVGRVVRFGVAVPGGADLRARIVSADPEGTSIDVEGLDGTRSVRLPTAGRHNVANALAVAGAALALGVPASGISAGLESFPGIGRRLQRLGEAGGVVVYDDYAHHPTAIRETIAAVRQREPGRRLWAVYEPLTYHRTAALLEEFATVLATADGVAIAEIWAGRDPDTTIASAESLAAAVRTARRSVHSSATGSPEETGRWLAERVRRGDAVLVMGGGRSYRIGEVLLESLARP
ncbi:MAG: UDP-N-acetylmuramate--L-alanine ligase [Chloroflexota bacterium]